MFEISWKRALTLVLLMASIEGCGVRAQPRVGRQEAPLALQFQILWTHDFALEQGFWGAETQEFGGPVETSNGLIVFGNRRGDIFALSKADGTIAWTVDIGEPFVSEPLVVNDTLYLGSASGLLYALDPRNGRKIWEFDTGASIEARVSVEGATLVAANALNRVYALNAKTGEFKWRKERSKVNDFTMFGHASPTLHEGVVYAGFSDGWLMAYALEDGATVWGRDLSKGNARFRDIDAAPLVVGDALFVASFAGGLYRLELATGEVVWHRELEGVGELSESDGVLYFASRDGVHATDSFYGEDNWVAPLNAFDIACGPEPGARNLYVGLKNEGLLVLDRQTGQRVALIDSGSGFSAPPLLVDNRLFLFSNDSMFYAYSVDDRPL
ncbi:MAG: hypothetical protein AUK47_23315 [Deltaproteobacteria bacterium CG2_30_63_29]|nr:MAG: hypothetical protein AUK47_23315 [Deltaproteobacteria bacterium CG2_30_63_29]PJB36935.1 MAG: hypothetical protein CO108_22190 [Deltaproteobacteria bacterium CG_4_9_14_3_um_filter_63_12]